MTLPLTPQPPIATYRGDYYRTNFTAGALLAILAETPGGVSVRTMLDTLTADNAEAGIPGGPAGHQWTPPGKRPSTGKAKPHGADPDDDDDDAPESETPETYPDTLREYCTYFDEAEDRVVAILRMLDYCRLIDYGGLGAEIRDLGREVLTLMQAAEEEERKNAAPGDLTPVQLYLAGDPRAANSGYLPKRPTHPFTITEAVRITAQQVAATSTPEDTLAELVPEVFAPAVIAAVKQPGMTIDISTGDPHLDTELPLRRNMHRRPSYRQFLWIILNDKNTFVLANIGVTPENVRLVATKAPTGSAEELRDNPTLARLKETRTLARKVRDFAQIVLSGGPEAVWAGKPLIAKDVHADISSFIAASRPGFTPRISKGSSLAWEAYERNPLSLLDYERAREALRDGYGNGLVSRETIPGTSGTDPTAIAEAAKADTDTRRLTIESAGDYVARTSDKVLEEIGIDVEMRPVMSPSGVPMDVRCQYHNVHINSETGVQTSFRCRGQSIGGSGYCERHGGTYLTAEETASLVRASQQKLFAGASRATEVMIELMLNSSNDAIRLRAAEQILNRSGLSESRDINLNVSDGTEQKTASQSVREKIKALAGLSPEAQKEITEQRNNGAISDYGEVIDAEVAEEMPAE